MKKKATPLEVAIQIVGTKAELARRLDVTPCYISKMLRENHVPIPQCRKIERLTNKQVTVEQLRPDIFKAA